MADYTLPDGRMISDEEWKKLPPDLQKKILTPGFLKGPSSGGEGTFGDFKDLASPEAGNKLWKMLSQNLPMAAVGGISGGLTGGPVGALAGAGMMGAFPPQNATQAAEAGAGQFTAGLAAKAENAIRVTQNPFVRAAIRGSLGLGQETLIDDPIRKALGEEAPGGITSKTIATLLPMLGGTVADRSLNSPRAKAQAAARGIKANLSDILGKDIDVNPEAVKAAASQGSKPAQEALMTAQQATKVVPEAQALQSQVSQIKQQGQQVAQGNLNKIDNQRDALLTAPMYSDDESQALRAGMLKQNAQLRARYEGLARGLPSADPHKQVIQALQKQKAQVLSQVGKNPLVTDDQLKLQANGIDDQITQHVAASFQSELDNLRKVSGQNASNLFDPKNPGTGKLQKTVDNVSKGANDNPIENIYLRNLTAPPPNTSGTPPGTPSKPASVESFVNNLTNLDERHVEALYQYLGNQPNGDSMIKGVRDALMNKFFTMAYDPKTQQLSNASKLIAGDGPFNHDKLKAIFGGGVEGDDAVNKFGQLVSDIGLLEKNQALASQSPWKMGLGHFGLYSTPTGLAYLAGGHKAAMAAAGMTLGFKAYSPLVDSVVTNPKFAEAFHNWASNGGDMDALRYTPVLASQFTGKGVATKELGSSVPPPSPPPSSQGGPGGQQPPQQSQPAPQSPQPPQSQGPSGPLGPLGVWPGSPGSQGGQGPGPQGPPAKPTGQ
jgi:hypothetical protein